MSFYQNVGIDFRQLTSPTPSTSTGGGTTTGSGTINGPLSIVSAPTASKVTTMTVHDVSGELSIVPSLNIGNGGVTIKNDCGVGYNGTLNITTLTSSNGNAGITIGKQGLFNYELFTYVNPSGLIKNSGGFSGGSLHIVKNSGKTSLIQTDPIIEMNTGTIFLYSNDVIDPKLWIKGSLGVGQVYDTVYNKPAAFDNTSRGVFTVKSASDTMTTTLNTVDYGGNGEFLMTPPVKGVSIVNSPSALNAGTLNLVAAGPLIGSGLNLTSDDRLKGYGLLAPLQNDLIVSGVKANDLTLYRYQGGQTYNILNYEAIDRSTITFLDPTIYDPKVYINGASGRSRVYDPIYNPPPAPVIPAPVALPRFTVIAETLLGGTYTLPAASVVTSMTTVVVLTLTTTTTNVFLPYLAIPPNVPIGSVSELPVNALVGIVLGNSSTLSCPIRTAVGISPTNTLGTLFYTIPATTRAKVHWFYHLGNNSWRYFT